MSLLKKGFTLSEMLIAMGIIGVVAAMTIPNMMKDTTGKQLETKLILFTTQLEKLARQHGDVDFLDKNELKAFLEAQLMFDDSSALGFDETTPRTLRDGTAIIISGSAPTKCVTTGTIADPDHACNADDSSDTLDNAGIIKFYPNIAGLTGRDHFNFYISKDGSIFPNKTDSNICAIYLYNKRYKAQQYYKTSSSDECKKQ